MQFPHTHMHNLDPDCDLLEPTVVKLQGEFAVESLPPCKIRTALARC
jgi:hypothetical protein